MVKMVPIIPKIKAELPLAGIGGIVIFVVGNVTGAEIAVVGTITIAVGWALGEAVGAAVAVGKTAVVGVGVA